jgi:hypothetical protein
LCERINQRYVIEQGGTAKSDSDAWFNDIYWMLVIAGERLLFEVNLGFIFRQHIR